MDQSLIESILADLKLPAIRFFSTIDSTNAEASRWIDHGAPHMALVVADEQTAGRGRLGRRWVTLPGAGLAFSLVLRLPSLEPILVTRLTGLGALSVQSSLKKSFSLDAQIKWPNDVLIDNRKVAGVLVETRWSGEALQSAIIGIGINIAPASVSAANLPPAGLNFPATCVEYAIRHPMNRLDVLHAVLQELSSWLPKLSSAVFLTAWEAALAYRHQWVELSSEGSLSAADERRITPASREGRLIGLAQDGSLKLLTSTGKLLIEPIGDVHLKPVQANQPAQTSA